MTGLVSTDKQTLDLLAAKSSDYVEAAELVRGGIVESRHRAIAAVTDPSGKLIDHLGSAKRVVYPRSAVKPLQTVAMRRAGFNLTGAALTITSASHQATPLHTQLVLEVLNSVNLGVDALQCPNALPGNLVARAAAQAPSRLYFNCSGKHAGFLAASKIAGFALDSYLDETHPLQLMVREVIEEFSGEHIVHTTIDGCGAPLHALTVEGLARSFGKLAQTEPEIVSAMIENPAVIGDENTADAILMRELGVISKLGAEGVLALATREGYGLAVKIADGSHRASAPILLGLLRKHELISADEFERVFDLVAPAVLGGDRVVGELRLL